MAIFFFNDTATTEIYTLSLHDALPISLHDAVAEPGARLGTAVPAFASLRPARSARRRVRLQDGLGAAELFRSEEHTSELQSRQYLVCRLLLEKKNRSPLPSAPTHLSPT